MKTATIQDVLSWNPCVEYTQDRITNLWAGRKKLSALDMTKLDIPIEDKLWAILRENLISANTLHLLACDFAERALSKIKSPDPRSVNAIKIKREWIGGNATDDELAAAWAAAWAAEDAAWAAAGTAEDAAAGAAAWAAAGAAEAAVRAAAGTAEDAAAGAAVRAAEEEWQLARVVEVLEADNENTKSSGGGR